MGKCGFLSLLPSLSFLWHCCQSTHTHTWKCPSHQLAWGIRVLTKTSWPSSLNFNKLQLRVDIGHFECVFKCVRVGWWHKAACICVYSFISCFCEAEFPLTEHGSAPLGGKWACCECVSVLQCVRSPYKWEWEVMHTKRNQSHLLVIEPRIHPLALLPQPLLPPPPPRALLSCKWLSWARGAGGGGG